MKDNRMAKKSRQLFWYARAVLAGGLMILSLVLFSSAFASQASNAKPADAVANMPTEVKASEVKPVETADSLSSTVNPQAEIHLSGSPSKGALLISSFTVFLLAVFVGVEVINKVPPTLHTPLMSGSNAISGITVIGALLTAGHVGGGFGAMLGMVAIVLAMINVVGGYLVTHRMLMMFKKR